MNESSMIDMILEMMRVFPIKLNTYKDNNWGDVWRVIVYYRTVGETAEYKAKQIHNALLYKGAKWHEGEYTENHYVRIYTLPLVREDE